MSDQKQVMEEVRYAMSTPGWRHILGMFASWVDNDRAVLELPNGQRSEQDQKLSDDFIRGRIAGVKSCLIGPNRALGEYDQIKAQQEAAERLRDTLATPLGSPYSRDLASPANPAES